MAGDCSLPGLGLSAEDWKTLADNVHVIFHCAATLRFDEALDVAVNVNVRGTKCILDLAKDTQNLEVWPDPVPHFRKLHPVEVANP